LTHMLLFSGNSNPHLAAQISKSLHVPLGKAFVGQFSDGETQVEIQENVRGKDVFILQSTSVPTNDHLIELLLMADAIRRAAALRITAVIPYFGYARQDKRIKSIRVPISARLMADLLATAGIHRVVTVDLHAEQIQGFFSMPVDNIYSSKVLLDDIKTKNYENPLIVSPDVGGVVRARAFAKRLNDADLAIIDKRRPHPNEAQVMNIIGQVKDRYCIIVDDMIDTGGTICKAASALKEKGAKKILAYCTHPVLSGKAVDSIIKSPIDELVVTDSIVLSNAASQCNKIRQLSLAGLLAEAVRKVGGETS
jgi:ribose-phosphate pyrophosphokinase